MAQGVQIKESVARALFIGAAALSIVAVAFICIFLFANGLPAMAEIGIPEFLTGMDWKPNNNEFGIFPMIVGSIYVTAGAIVVGVPIGLLCAIYLSRFASGKIAGLLKPGV
ncbi:MAG: phosphate ABC transporter permease subunit PstC, partial [Eggerthellaceae bacterium]